VSTTIKPFAQQGHYVGVHDAVFDVIMPYCPPNAFKILMFILRKTRGWNKPSDVLRYDELQEGTGIGSRATLAKELDWLKNKKLILATNEDGTPHRSGSRKAPAYSLNPDFELRSDTSSKSEPEPSSQNEPTTSSIIEPSNKQSKQETITSTNVDEGKAQKLGKVIPLDKNITDELYDFLKANGIRWDQDEYGFHLGRVQDMLKHDAPTDEELEELPRDLLKLYAVTPSKADAPKALRQMRRNGIREEVVGEWKRGREEREDRTQEKRNYDALYPTYTTRSDGTFGPVGGRDG
jgi:hypothetical protein